jgi:NIMA (never in mitosis gene a)-related kinase 2
MSTKERDQLQAEFSILASLKSPHIVGYFHREHIKSTQELFLYMEYCGGGDLGGVIKTLKRNKEYAKEEMVWRFMSQIIVALYRCHYGIDPPEPGDDCSRQKDNRSKKKNQEIMILHRDLKPENIFLAEDQSVKLGDFGLSKQMQSHDFASTYVGTPFYMSPEICAAERYTHHSDIWSLGCIMYELCTHEPPFNATTHYQLIQRIRKGDFAQLPSCYSRELSTVISSCLRVNHLQRPDAASLLSVPQVWFARKQQELVTLNKAVKAKELSAEQLMEQANERLSALETDRANMKADIESQVRREWEVKARLEIDRQAHLNFKNLQNKYEEDVRRRVEEEVAARLAAHNIPSESQATKDSHHQIPTIHSSSVNTMGEEDFPSTTDLTDLSQLSIESPESATLKPIPPKKTKTPFARSKTTFDSPADVHMSEPSPMSISGLALSPRRNAAAQATASSTTTTYGAKNIFAEAARQRARWEPQLAYASEDEENIEPTVDDSDDDSIPELPSPTRAKATVASTDPFKHPPPPKFKPGLIRQNTMATMQKLSTKPTLFPTTNTATATARAEAMKAATAAAAKSDPDLSKPTPTSRPSSPNRRMSKIPSRNDFAIIADRDTMQPPTSPIRRANTTTGLKSKLNSTKHEFQHPHAYPSQTTIGGRTLVELAQARAGGRPMSADLTATGNGIGSIKGKAITGPSGLGNLLDRELPPVPVWDPDVEGDAMPSPFLKRDVRNVGDVREVRSLGFGVRGGIR